MSGLYDDHAGMAAIGATLARRHFKAQGEPATIPFTEQQLSDALRAAAVLAAEVETLPIQPLVNALVRAQQFIRGFDGDSRQKGLDSLLKQISDALAQAGV